MVTVSPLLGVVIELPLEFVFAAHEGRMDYAPAYRALHLRPSQLGRVESNAVARAIRPGRSSDFA